MGHVQIVAALAELGANLDAPNLRGESPCWAAALAGHFEVVALLSEVLLSSLSTRRLFPHRI